MTARTLQLCFVMTALVLVCSAGQDRAASSHRLRLTTATWNVENGLPQNTVNSLIQTSDGYIWFGTTAGLVRFDGSDMTVFNTVTNPELKSDRVLFLAEDHSRNLWIGFEDGGLASFADGRFVSYADRKEIGRSTILHMVVDAAGDVWFVMLNRGVGRYRNGEFRFFSREDGVPDSPSLTKDNRGSLIVTSTADARIFDGRSFVRSPLIARLTMDASLIPVIDREGNIWTGTFGVGLERRSAAGVRVWTERDGLCSSFIRAVLQDRSGRIWIGTDAGLNMFDGTTLYAFGRAEGFGIREINSLLEDNEGNLWLGTKTSGLVRVQPTPFTAYTLPGGEAINNATSICATSSGAILYGVNCGGMNMIAADGTVSNILPHPRMENGCVWSVFEDAAENLWIGTWGGGVHFVPRWRTTLQQQGKISRWKKIPSDVVLSIMQTKDGALWFGTLHDGLFRYDGLHVVSIGADSGRRLDQVRSMEQDLKGRVWIGTSGGMYQLASGSDTVAQEVKEFPAVPIRAIHVDADNVLWVGTYGRGLVRFKNRTSVALTSAQGLYDDLVSHVLEDRDGWFWMGCNRGVFTASRQELNAIADGARRELAISAFTTAHGMLNRETNGGFRPSACQTPDGRLWFPTVQGVVAVDPATIRRNMQPPPVIIENVAVDRVRRPVGSPVIIEPAQQMLEIHYAALNFTAPERVRFKYRLEGLDTAWYEAGTAHDAVYMRLPPGKFRFTVIAANNDGVWNTVGASLDVVVLPPFWRTPWFLAIMGFVIVFAGPSFYFWRIRQLKKRAMGQEAFSRQLLALQEQERKRIAGEIHDSLSQNILLIKHRVQLAQEECSTHQKVSDQLTQISLLAAETLEDTRRMAHELRPIHLDRLGLTETIRQLVLNLSSATGLAVEHEITDVDRLLQKDDEIILYRILQETINNVLKHAKATTLAIVVGLDDNKLRMFVQDNGVGFDAEAYLASERSRTGHGVSSLIERVHILNGEFNISSHPGGGTTVVVRIPVMGKGT